jgi:hypothetical protein
MLSGLVTGTTVGTGFGVLVIVVLFKRVHPTCDRLCCFAVTVRMPGSGGLRTPGGALWCSFPGGGDDRSPAFLPTENLSWRE